MNQTISLYQCKCGFVIPKVWNYSPALHTFDRKDTFDFCPACTRLRSSWKLVPGHEIETTTKKHWWWFSTTKVEFRVLEEVVDVEPDSGYIAHVEMVVANIPLNSTSVGLTVEGLKLIDPDKKYKLVPVIEKNETA